MPFLIVLVAFIALCISVYLKSPTTKGKIGELRIKKLIGKTVPEEKYIINDLVLETENGRTCQIDHIVINERGIFVIETKNYSGRIYGQEHQQEWTQVLKYGKVKNKFYNPIKQNNTHIYHLAHHLSCQLPIHSAVVFVQGNTYYIDASDVFTPRELKRFLKEGEDVLSIEQMESAYDELLNADQIDISDDEHIQNIRKMKRLIALNVCPRCGKALVKRHGKHGGFYGCSGYPSCKFTKKL